MRDPTPAPCGPLRPAHEATFVAHDGVPLFYRHWPAAGPRAGAIVLLHRGH